MKPDVSNPAVQPHKHKILRDIEPPSTLHILARPRRQTMAAQQDGADVFPGGPVGAADEQAELERQAVALQQAYQSGLAQGRQAVLEDELARQRQAGYEAGLAAGNAVAQEAARAELAEHLRSLEQVLRALPAHHAELLTQAEEDMVALSMETVHRLLGEQAAQVDVVRDLVQCAVRNYRGEREVAVHLHPSDYQCLLTDVAFSTWQAGQQAGVRLIADHDVQLGGLMLRTNAGSLDARLEYQLQMLHVSLLQQRERQATRSVQTSELIRTERRVGTISQFGDTATRGNLA